MITAHLQKATRKGPHQWLVTGPARPSYYHGAVPVLDCDMKTPADPGSIENRQRVLA